MYKYYYEVVLTFVFRIPEENQLMMYCPKLVIVNQPRTIPGSATHVTFTEDFNEPISELSPSIIHLTFGKRFCQVALYLLPFFPYPSCYSLVTPRRLLLTFFHRRVSYSYFSFRALKSSLLILSTSRLVPPSIAPLPLNCPPPSRTLLSPSASTNRSKIFPLHSPTSPLVHILISPLIIYYPPPSPTCFLETTSISLWIISPHH